MCHRCWADSDSDMDEEVSEAEYKAYSATRCDSPTAEMPLILSKYLKKELDYEDDGKEPPFTPRQMIAAVLMCDGTKLQYEKHIPTILINTFKYYHSKVCDFEALYAPYCSCPRRNLAKAILLGLDQVFSPFETIFYEDHTSRIDMVDGMIAF